MASGAFVCIPSLFLLGLEHTFIYKKNCQTPCFEKILENLTKISDFSLYCPHLPHHEAESTYSNGPKDCQTYVSIQ